MSTTFTVICTWSALEGGCDEWEDMSVTVTEVDNPEEAAESARLAILKERSGRVRACLVIEGTPSIHVPNGDVVDAEDESIYVDDDIPFNGQAVISGWYLNQKW